MVREEGETMTAGILIDAFFVPADDHTLPHHHSKIADGQSQPKRDQFGGYDEFSADALHGGCRESSPVPSAILAHLTAPQGTSRSPVPTDR